MLNRTKYKVKSGQPMAPDALAGVLLATARQELYDDQGGGAVRRRTHEGEKGCLVRPDGRPVIGSLACRSSPSEHEAH